MNNEIIRMDIYIYKFAAYTEGEISKLRVDETDGFTQEWYDILRAYDQEEYDLFCENGKNNLPFYDEFCLCTRSMCQSAENAYINRGVKERIQEQKWCEQERDIRRVRRALGKLTKAQKELQKMIFRRKLKTKEIAKLENTTISAIKDRKKRLFKTLRRLLKRY